MNGRIKTSDLKKDLTTLLLYNSVCRNFLSSCTMANKLIKSSKKWLQWTILKNPDILQISSPNKHEAQKLQVILLNLKLKINIFSIWWYVSQLSGHIERCCDVIDVIWNDLNVLIILINSSGSSLDEAMEKCFTRTTSFSKDIFIFSKKFSMKISTTGQNV